MTPQAILCRHDIKNNGGLTVDQMRWIVEAMEECFILKSKEKIREQANDFLIDRSESVSTYVKQNCDGALFGLERLSKSISDSDKWFIDCFRGYRGKSNNDQK